MTLYVQSGLLSLSLPHLTREVRSRVHDLVLSLIYVYVALLHLCAELPHHNRRLGLVLIGLNDSLVSLWVIARCLVGLCERVVVPLAGFGVPETAYVRLSTALFLDLNSNDFDLVVSESNLNLEHGRHHELVGLNRVEVVLLLLLLLLVHLPTRDVHLLLLLLLLKVHFFLLNLVLFLLLMMVLVWGLLSTNCHATLSTGPWALSWALIAHVTFHFLIYKKRTAL